jgi:hypothetical protein
MAAAPRHGAWGPKKTFRGANVLFIVIEYGGEQSTLSLIAAR